MEAPLVGRLLVATPPLIDPNFFRAVVLVAEHSDENGALGIILNRPSLEEVADHLPQWARHLAPPAVVFEGGPVQRDVGVGVGGCDEGIAIAGWNPITDRIGLYDVSTDPAEATGLARLRIFSGYSGWSPGQLEQEVATGSWFVVGSEGEDPFSPTPETLWRDVLARQPGSLALFANFPPHPRFN